MSVQTIARRYAQALVEVVTDRGEAGPVQQELSQWASMIESSPELREILGNPTIPYDKKRLVLNELIGRSRVREVTANFLQLLLRNQRLTEIGDIYRKFLQILDERSGMISARVTTARPLTEASKAALAARFDELTGRKVRFTFDIDEGLIGGMVAKIGSTIYDGSVRNQLHEARQELLAD